MGRIVVGVLLAVALSIGAWAEATRPIVAGQRIGSVWLHMVRPDVLHRMGPPKTVFERWMCYGTRQPALVSPQEYEFMVLMDDGGHVQTMRTYSAHYRTALGVGPGSTLARLRQKYRTRLQTLVQTQRLDTLWVHEGQGTVLFYVSPAQSRVLAVEISI